MPKGFDTAQEAFADINARTAAGGGQDNTVYLKLKAGESAVVRFLEQGDEIAWAWVHELEPRGKQRWGDHVPCRRQTPQSDERCPGCEQGLDRSFLGWINLIWRDGPVYKRDSEGNLMKSDQGLVREGTADVLAVWERGKTTFEELAGKDATYKGLRSRDFRITRYGSGMSDTKYVIEPADVDSGPQPLSDTDKALMEKKEDLLPRTLAPAYEEWGGGPTKLNGSPAPAGEQAVEGDNPFLQASKA